MWIQIFLYISIHYTIVKKWEILEFSSDLFDGYQIIFLIRLLVHKRKQNTFLYIDYLLTLLYLFFQ